MRRNARGLWPALVVMAGIITLFFAPAFQSSVQFLYRDTGRLHEPMKRFVAQELRQGRFPAWNPYAGLGTPLVGGSIDAVQHPFNLLLLLPSFDLGFKLWILLSYLLAAAGAFFWARVLGRSWQAAIGTGMVFALSGSMVSSSDNLTYLTAYAALPWIFVAAHRWMEEGGPGRLALVGVASALCAAAGDPQSWVFATTALPLYGAVLADGGQRRWRAVCRGVAAAVVSAVAAAPFILPVVAWMPFSSRTVMLEAGESQRWNLHPVRLAELIVPHLFQGNPGTPVSKAFATYAGNEYTNSPWLLAIYLGVTVLALAVIGAARSRRTWWLVCAAGVGAWMAMGPHGGFGQLASHVPVLDHFRYWEKMTVWPTLLMALAASRGIDALADGEMLLRRRVIQLTGLVALLLVGGIAFIAAAPDLVVHLVERDGAHQAAIDLVSNLREGVFHAGLACSLLTVVALALDRGWLSRAARLALLCIAVADPLTANVSAYFLAGVPSWSDPPLAQLLRADGQLIRVTSPFEMREDRWPELTPVESTWRWGARTLVSAWNVPVRVGNFRPYLGMHSKRLVSFLAGSSQRVQNVGVGLWGVSGLVVPARPELAQQAGLKPPLRVSAEDPELPAYLVEIPHRPRAYLAEELAAGDEIAAQRFVLDPATIDSPRVVVEAPLPSGWSRPQGNARIVEDAPCRTEIETRSDRQALLILNDAFAPGWTAEIDGRIAEVLQANYLVRGVWIPKGAHRVIFRYRTPWLREGWALVGVGAAVLAAWAKVRRRAATLR